MSDQPKSTAADQPPSGKDLPEEVTAAINQVRELSGDIADALAVPNHQPGCQLTYRGTLLHQLLQAALVLQWAIVREHQRAEELQHDLELQREVSAELGRQNEQLIGSTEELPREIQELIYRSSCCVPTPEAAQKEPCACVAYAIVEKVEEWAGAQATKRAETAEAELAACKSKCILWIEQYGEKSNQLLDVKCQLTAAHKRLAKVREKLKEIVVTEGCDAGVVLLSDYGPTHYDAELKCQIYDHAYFSPLGDALVELAALAEGEG